MHLGYCCRVPVAEKPPHRPQKPSTPVAATGTNQGRTREDLPPLLSSSLSPCDHTQPPSDRRSTAADRPKPARRHTPRTCATSHIPRGVAEVGTRRPWAVKRRLAGVGPTLPPPRACLGGAHPPRRPPHRRPRAPTSLPDLAHLRSGPPASDAELGAPRGGGGPCAVARATCRIGIGRPDMWGPPRE